MSAISTRDNRPTRVEHFVGGMFEPTQTDIYPELHELLSSIPSDLGDGEWKAVLAAVHSASGGSVEGLKAIDDWSPLGDKRKSGAVLETWASLESGEGGMTALARIAERYGANITEIGERHGSLTHLLAELPDLGDFDITGLLKEEGEPSTAHQGAPDAQLSEFEKDVSSRVAEMQASAIRADLAKPVLNSRYLIKGLLAQNDVSMVFGPSNVGKSLVALDLANSIARGGEWNGRKVDGGPVIYFALEGGGGIQNRLHALRDGASENLHVLIGPVVLRQNPVDLEAMIQAANELAGGKPAMIVIDTLSRAIPGADENAANEMTNIITILESIRSQTRAHVMLVHHSGKDFDRGPRGHSSLIGAVDTAIACQLNGGSRFITDTKQREWETGQKFYFEINSHVVGSDNDGDEVTAGVVIYKSQPEGREKQRSLGKNQEIFMKCFERLCIENTEPKAGNPGTERKDPGVDRDILLSTAAGEMGKSGDKANKRAAREALNDLLDKDFLVEDGTMIQVPTRDCSTSS